MISGRSKKTKRLGTERRWTLLFIGDHGDVIALKRFKAIVITATIIFFGVICAGAILFLVNHNTVSKNKELQRFLEKSKVQIESLRQEKEVLMARLVIAESKAKEKNTEDQKSEAKINSGDPIPPKTPPILKELEKKADQKIPPLPETTPSKPEAVATAEPEPEPESVLSVAVENFSIAYEQGTEKLNAQFKIKNTSSPSQAVSGHTVVVLKGEDLPIDQWLVMPAVTMAGDIPSGKRGKTFSIQRFRTMNFTFETPEYFNELHTAVVYVFLKSGELILEQDFPVTLPPAPAPEIKASSSPQRSSEHLPAESPSTETHWYDDPTTHLF